MIGVKKLTKKIVTETIKAYLQKADGYWLKFCPFGDDLDISILTKLELQHREKLELSEREGFGWLV